MFKKISIAFLLLASFALAQTPCVDAAKTGAIGACLNISVPVTAADASWIPVAPVNGYTVASGLNYNTKLEFSSLEQAQAVLALVVKAAADAGLTSNLAIVDYADQFYFPPFRKLAYGPTNGGEYSPRLYLIRGTIGGKTIADLSVGWFINVTRLIYGGNFEAPDLGLPFGNSRLVIGNGAPMWVGN